MNKAISLNVPGLGNVNYKKLGDLTAAELNEALTKPTITYTDKRTGKTTIYSHYQLFNENSAAAPFSPAKGARNGIDLYQVDYKITNKGQLDTVTGLLAVPTGLASKTVPLLSWQHGTVFQPYDAPSGIMHNDQLQRTAAGSTFAGVIRSSETLFNLVRLAGNGYAMAAADYNGNGGSTTPQYYSLKEPSNKATTGMITAAKAILSRLGFSANKLFLNGWSQGALNTLWLGEQLRQAKIPVTKQSSSSTFSDYNKVISYWFNTFKGDPNWGTSVIPLMLSSYESYYNLNGLMKEAIKPQYYPIAKAIQEGYLNWDNLPLPAPGEGIAGLPLTGKELLNEKFVSDFNNKRGRFYEKFKENTGVMEQKMSHPTRFYGGDRDTIVPAGVSVEQPTAFFAPLATGTNVGPSATHRSTFVGSLFGSVQDPGIDIGTWYKAP